MEIGNNLEINPLQDASVSVDSFINEAVQPAPFSVDTQAQATEQPTASDGNEPPQPPPVAPLPPPTEPISEGENAVDKVKRFLWVRGTVISFLLAFYIKDFGAFKNFSTTKAENDALYEVYKEYADLFGGMPKYLDLIAVEAMILVPKFLLAQKLRNIKTYDTPPPPEQQNNYEGSNVGSMAQNDLIERKFFNVDEGGLYIYQPTARIYVKKSDRIKANVTLHYAELCQANGKDVIDKIFSM